MSNPAIGKGIPRPSPSRGACRAFAKCEIEIDFKKGVSEADQADCLAYLNRLIQWCQIPGTIVPYDGPPVVVSRNDR